MDAVSTGKRSDRIDLARALSIVMIVMAHVLRSGNVADYLSSTGVATFFFLGGVVFHRYDNWASYLKKRLVRLYLPYLGVALFSIAVYTLVGYRAQAGLEDTAGVSIAGSPSQLLANLAGMLYANSKNGSMKWNETLWFLPCYLVTTLLAIAVEEIVAHTREWVRLLIIALCFPLIYLVTNTCHLHLPFQTETALHMLPLFEAGVLVKGWYLKEQKERKLAELLCFAALFALSVAAAVFLGPVSIRTDKYPNFPLSYLLLVAGVLQVLSLSVFLEIKRPNKAEKALCLLGQHSLGVMLWNKFPVVFFQLVLPKVSPVFGGVFSGENTALDVLLSVPLAVISILLCLLATYLLQRIGAFFALKAASLQENFGKNH